MAEGETMGVKTGYLTMLKLRDEKERFVKGHPGYGGSLDSLARILNEAQSRKIRCVTCGKLITGSKAYRGRKYCSIKCRDADPEYIRKRNESANATAKKLAIKPNLVMDVDLAYVLGVLFGDGSVSKQAHIRLECHESSENFADSFFKALQNIGLNPSKKLRFIKSNWNKNGGSMMWSVVATSKRFEEWFRELSYDKLENMLSTNELMSAFIRGFYESEGSYTMYCRKNKAGWSTPQYKICIRNTDLQLTHLVYSLISKLGFHPTLYEEHGKKRGYSYILYTIQLRRKQEVIKFLEYIKPSIKNKPSNRDKYVGGE